MTRYQVIEKNVDCCQTMRFSLSLLKKRPNLKSTVPI